MVGIFKARFFHGNKQYETRSRGSSEAINRVGINPGFYHKAQTGRFYGFYEGGFWGFYGSYVGFINLKVYHNSHNQLLPNSFSVLKVLV